ncbi:MAG: hypothetical protein AAF655_03250 [Bacteroidota bacterium]
MKTYMLAVVTLFATAFGPATMSAQQFVSNIVEKDSNEIRTKSRYSSTAVIPDAREFVWVDKEAVPLNMASVIKGIAYPDELLTAGFEPMVQISVLVDEFGNPIRHIWLTETDHAVKDAVDPSVSFLRFTPAERDGEAVYSWVSLAFKFNIR